VRKPIEAEPEVVTDLPKEPELKPYSDITIIRDKLKFMITVLKYADEDADLIMVQLVTRLNSQYLGEAMQNELDLRGYTGDRCRAGHQRAQREIPESGL
jgi:hypothetical protein